MYAHWREDVELLGTPWGYAQSTASRRPGAFALGHAIADTLGDARGVLPPSTAWTSRTWPHWRATVTWLRATAELALGSPRRPGATPSWRSPGQPRAAGRAHACSRSTRWRRAATSTGPARRSSGCSTSWTVGNDHTRRLRHRSAGAFAGEVDEADRLTSWPPVGGSPLPSLRPPCGCRGGDRRPGDEDAPPAAGRPVDGHKVSEAASSQPPARAAAALRARPDTRDQFEALEGRATGRPAAGQRWWRCATGDLAWPPPCGARTGRPRRRSCPRCGRSSWPPRPRPGQPGADG